MRKLAAVLALLLLVGCLHKSTSFHAQPLGAPSGGDRASVIPLSWTVPAWYIDPTNSTTCASDNNNCTSSTCGSAGSFVGPCVSYAEVAARWGTYAPILQQNTTVQWLSNGPATDPVIFTGYGIAGTNLYLAGTLVTQSFGASVFGTVTPRNRAAGTSTVLQAAMGTATAGIENYFLQDTTHAGVGWVFATTASQVGLTQPCTSNATPGTPPSAPTEVTTYATGDAFAVKLPTTVRLVNIQPLANTAFTPYVYLMHLWENNTGLVTTMNSYVVATESRFDEDVEMPAFVQNGALGFGGFYNCNITTGATSSLANVAILAGNTRSDYYWNSYFDNDVVISSRAKLGGFGVDVSGISTTDVGNTFGNVATAFTDLSGTTVALRIAGGLTVLSSIYGTGSVTLQTGNASTLHWINSQTATNTFTVPSITWQMCNTANTTAYSAGTGAGAVWNGGIAINVTNLDAVFSTTGFGGAAIRPDCGSVIENH